MILKRHFYSGAWIHRTSIPLTCAKKETGEIIYTSKMDDLYELPEDIDDDDKYIVIPHKNDLDLGKALVFEFANKGSVSSFL
jgi:hypothetical protein